jgi:predicted lipoprotein with Yx(FWY)xxD motif
MQRLLIAVPVLAVAVIALIVAIASGNGTDRTTTRPTSNGASASIGLHRTALGRYLVDGHGRALYLFEADKPNMSNCTSACLSIWPPFTATKTPKAAPGVSASKIATIRAAGGKRQVVYNGHPLYHYVADHNPGDTTGQGLDQFGAEWYVLAAGGGKIDHG